MRLRGGGEPGFNPRQPGCMQSLCLLPMCYLETTCKQVTPSGKKADLRGTEPEHRNQPC